jgi:hypothetical protein
MEIQRRTASETLTEMTLVSHEIFPETEVSRVVFISTLDSSQGVCGRDWRMVPSPNIYGILEPVILSIRKSAHNILPFQLQCKLDRGFVYPPAPQRRYSTQIVAVTRGTWCA